MDLKLKDKVVIVTGGAKGIGAGITEALARESARVCVAGRSPEAGEALAEKLRREGRTVTFHSAELTDGTAVADLVERVLAGHGRIDAIVNNAGRNDAVGLRAGREAFENSLRTNVVHFYTLVHHALDALIESRGTILNIGSKCAVTGQGGTSGYAASKGAINALTREWAVDLAEHGIRVNCLIPAEVITPLYEAWLSKAPDPVQAREQLNRTIPFERRTTTVEEVADTAAFLVSERSSHTTGQILFVDGGYVHLDRAATMDTSHLESS